MTDTELSHAEIRDRAVFEARFRAVARLAGEAVRLAPSIRHPSTLDDVVARAGVVNAECIDWCGALIVAVLDASMSPGELETMRERAGVCISLEASAAITSYLVERRTVD